MTDIRFLVDENSIVDKSSNFFFSPRTSTSMALFDL
jgi:hypothetical protein